MKSQAAAAVQRTNLLYAGKNKSIYETDQPDLLILEFNDQGIADKARWNMQIAAKIFQTLESKGVATHFERALTDRSFVVKRLSIIRAETTVRNRVAGSMLTRCHFELGAWLPSPVYELRYKSDALSDPFINESYAMALKLATEDELKVMRERSFEINNVLLKFFSDRGLDLVDFRLEFGRFRGKVILGDDISADTMRLWDKETSRRWDKETLRQNPQAAADYYCDIAQRIVGSE